MATTFELLHGAWHDPSCWDLLVPELRARGHDAITPELPLHDPDAGYEYRARRAIDAAAGVMGSLVLVAHSMSSSYGPLIAKERKDALLVYLCPSLGPFAAPPGAPEKFRPHRPSPSAGPDGTTVWDPEAAITTLYARLPEPHARKLAARLRPMADPPDEFPLPTHPDVQTALICASDDEFFEPAWERFMARELLGVEPIEIPGGHFPMIEDPAGLAAVLARLAD